MASGSGAVTQIPTSPWRNRSSALEAVEAPLKLKRGTRYTVRREPYFFDYVQEELIERYGVGVVRRGGLKIHTTIEPGLQDAAREAINAFRASGSWAP